MRTFSVQVTRVATGETVQVQIQARSLAAAEKLARSEFPWWQRFDVSAGPVRWSQHLPLAAARKRASWADEVFAPRAGLVSVT